MRIVIRVVHLYKEYENHVTVLHDINLSVNKGEFLAIIGPSGSGKTTLMNLLGCLDKPSRGKIYIDGHDVSHLREKNLSILRRNMIGFVFQSFCLLPNLSAKENIELPLFYNGIPKAARNEISIGLLERMGLQKRAEHFPNQLSGGQRQRVAIARALVNDPSLILADEPTGNLDRAASENVIKIFRELNREGKTILLITHDLRIASSADRIVTVQNGKVV